MNKTWTRIVIVVVAAAAVAFWVFFDRQRAPERQMDNALNAMPAWQVIKEQEPVLHQRILDQIRAAGIVRVVTVCPGCGEEFVELMGDEVDIVPLPELLLQKSRAAERAGRPTGFAPLPERSVTFFDSCHDRFDGRHGAAIRALVARNLPGTARLEMDHRRKGTLCCGAGGACCSTPEPASPGCI